MTPSMTTEIDRLNLEAYTLLLIQLRLQAVKGTSVLRSAALYKRLYARNRTVRVSAKIRCPTTSQRVGMVVVRVDGFFLKAGETNTFSVEADSLLFDFNDPRTLVSFGVTALLRAVKWAYESMPSLGADESIEFDSRDAA